MASQHEHRLILVVPVDNVAAVVEWMHTNVGPDSVPADLGPGLNATGDPADPVTHHWCCGSFIDAECKAILTQLCQFAATAPPTKGQWDDKGGTDKVAWLKSTQPAIKSGYGVHVGLARNTGVWDSPEDALKAMELQRVNADATKEDDVKK